MCVERLQMRSGAGAAGNQEADACKKMPEFYGFCSDADAAVVYIIFIYCNAN